MRQRCSPLRGVLPGLPFRPRAAFRTTTDDPRVVACRGGAVGARGSRAIPLGLDRCPGGSGGEGAGAGPRHGLSRLSRACRGGTVGGSGTAFVARLPTALAQCAAQAASGGGRAGWQPAAHGVLSRCREQRPSHFTSLDLLRRHAWVCSRRVLLRATFFVTHAARPVVWRADVCACLAFFSCTIHP